MINILFLQVLQSWAILETDLNQSCLYLTERAKENKIFSFCLSEQMQTHFSIHYFLAYHLKRFIKIVLPYWNEQKIQFHFSSQTVFLFPKL
jgi:hypothetical protein